MGDDGPLKSGRKTVSKTIAKHNRKIKNLSKSNAPCSHCGSLQLVRTMDDNNDEIEEDDDRRMRKLYKKNLSLVQEENMDQDSNSEEYVSSLLQQVKLLELEVAYLKHHHNHYHARKTSGNRKVKDPDKDDTERRQTTKEIEDSGSPHKESEHHENFTNYDSLSREKDRLLNRIAQIENRGEEEKSRFLQEISVLMGKIEVLRNDATSMETRFTGAQSEFEKLSILCKEKSNTIARMTEEMKAKEDEFNNLMNDLNSIKTTLALRENQFNELQEKFMQSSVHVMEETIRGLKNENSVLQRTIKERELRDEASIQIRLKSEEHCQKLVQENADLSALAAEIKSKLDSEVRLRENRESKALLNVQEVFSLREKERTLKEQCSSIQDQLDREREKIKSHSDKLEKELQLTTTLELKNSTQKCRISELEGSLSFAHESTDKIRKNHLMDQEKISVLHEELKLSRSEYRDKCQQLSECEDRLLQTERKCEGLSNLQSQRWMEFSRMADSMKELSHSMLEQSKSNTEKSKSSNPR